MITDPAEYEFMDDAIRLRVSEAWQMERRREPFQITFTGLLLVAGAGAAIGFAAAALALCGGVL